jgi:superfamily I DNA/RNA helicase
MSWFIPYNQLDNEQLSFLQNVENNKSSNFWLKGYAGSGKSVLLIHCLLSEKEKNPNARIIIVLYTLALIDMIKAGIPNQYHDVKVVTYQTFSKMHDTWDLILVDEVQDLRENTVREIQSKGKRVIVAGDVNQSIYDNVCETQQIANILSSQSVSLGIIHRISRRVRQVAQFFCSDRNGFNSAALGRLVELPPRLIKANSYLEECKWLVLNANEYAKAGYAPSILIPRHLKIFEFLQTVLSIENKPLMPEDYRANSKENYLKINNHLKTNGLKFQYLGNGAGSFEDASKHSLVTVMTYHSAKGLDFKAVFIPFLTPSLEIWNDPESRARTLFFVAVTRSREQLFLSYNGDIKHPYLNLIPEADFHKLKASDEIIRMTNPISSGNDNEEPLVVF